MRWGSSQVIPSPCVLRLGCLPLEETATLGPEGLRALGLPQHQGALLVTLLALCCPERPASR